MRDFARSISDERYVSLNFRFRENFAGPMPEAYQRLLLDVMIGDATLFTRSDEVLAAWDFTTKIIQSWKEYPVRNLPVYEAGTWGPPGADDFIAQHRWSWRTPV